MSDPTPQPKPKRRLKVEPEEGGQLEQYLIVNTQAAGAAKEAGEEAEAYKAAVKSWLLALFPPLPDGSPNPGLPDAFDITADPHGRYPAYTMALKEGTHLDQEAMKRDGVHESVYGVYSVPNRPSWELRASTGGGRR